MSKKTIPYFDIEFVRENLYIIDAIQIDPDCHENCRHSIRIHFEKDLIYEWISFENKVDTTLLWPFYDLISEDFRKHFSWMKEDLKTKYLNFNCKQDLTKDLHYLLFNRMNHVHREKLDEKVRIIDFFRQEIKELNQEIVKLKFKIG